MKNIKFISILNSFKTKTFQEPMVSLGNSIELLALFKGLGWRVISACFPKGVKLSKRLSLLYAFGLYILSLKTRHGNVYAVKYLKSCTLAIQKKVSGSGFKTLREIEPDLPLPRLINGLPAFIPKADRQSINRGDSSIIRQ